MKKTNYTTIELQDVIKIDGELNIHECNYYHLVYLYYIYLEDKGIRLTYNNQDLKEYANKYKHVVNNDEDVEDWQIEIDKISKKRLQNTTIAFLITFCGLFELGNIGLDSIIYYDCIQKNTNYILDNFTEDTNNDRIPEVDLEKVASYDDYHDPSNNAFYRVTNPFHNIKDYKVVFDRDSLKVALTGELFNSLDDINIIEIDGTIYTVSGSMSRITFESNNIKYRLLTIYTFDESKDMNKQAEDLLKYHFHIKNPTNIEITEHLNTKTFEELPSISVNKETDNIKILQK